MDCPELKAGDLLRYAGEWVLLVTQERGYIVVPCYDGEDYNLELYDLVEVQPRLVTAVYRNTGDLLTHHDHYDIMALKRYDKCLFWRSENVEH